MYLIVGTGHRPPGLNWDPDPKTWLWAVDYLEQRLLEALEAHGPLVVVTGMAEGFDLVLGAAGDRLARKGLPVRVVCAIPFAGDTAYFKHPTAVKWHTRIRSEAAKVWVGANTRHTYAVRNQWLIDRFKAWNAPGEVWCAWNGKFGKPGGGTGQTVRFARQAGLEPVNLFEVLVKD